jgi:16S rRNA (cytidine1402-2'-O)-methyltransferase
MQGRLILVPVTLGNEKYVEVIPQGVLEKIKNLRFFVVEEIRTARRFLRLIDKTFPIDDTTFFVLNEHTSYNDIESYLIPAINGNDIGVMSEAGLPCIADPGATIVKLAHIKGIEVQPLTGPSSIIMALIASGLNGQNFTFNGYLPKEKSDRAKKIIELEKLSKKGFSQIFMETPYRNQQLLETLLETCHSNTYLCIAIDITLDSEKIATKKISEWKNNTPSIKDHYAVFVI